MKKKVLILMSTYNGEKYLEEQLDSIISQTYDNINLLIRDDGSTDNTLGILEKYSKKYSKIKYYVGKNVKPAKSFFDLIKSADKFDFYAFSDQDDVWDRDKIEMAVKQINQKKNDLPTLYFSDTRLVDKNLKEVKNVRKIKKNKINLGNALIENIATGCTIVFNNELMQLLKRIDLDSIKNGYMHDSIAYRLCFLTGDVIYDEIPHISYRQHENNVIGNSSKIKDKILKRKKTLHTTINLRSNMANFLYLKFNDKTKDESKEIILKLVNYKNTLHDKINLLFDFKIRRMNLIDDFFYRLAIIMNKI